MTDPASAAVATPITLRDSETIAFYGDSITQQNLYSAYIETFLLTRLPGKDLRFVNYGWGGDTAPGGAGRFARDVAPARPSLVLVTFGMNDGRYSPPDDTVRDVYLNGQRALADAIAGIGARQVLLAPSPVDVRGGVWLESYNATLGRFADEVARLAESRGLPFIDIFRPVLAVVERAQREQPALRLIPDGVHPDDAGHLLIAYAALKRFALPAGLGDIRASAQGAFADGPARISGVRAGDGTLAFDLQLPFLPFFVPESARAALALVPFQQELNHFRLDCSGWATERSLSVSVDGVEIALLGRDERAAGIDLAALDLAPWAARGRKLWDLAQQRWRLHLQAWREFGIEAAPETRALAGFEAMNQAMKRFVDEQGRHLRQLAQPGTYRVTIAESDALAIGRVQLSPLYPFDPASPADFDRVHEPETAPERVPWRVVAFVRDLLDLGAHQGAPSNCVCYVRFVLETAVACRIHLDLGSDDGLTVLAVPPGGTLRRLLARNVQRGCRLGDDTCDIDLEPGRTAILLRVTQAGGGYAVALRIRVLGGARVRHVAP